MSQNRLKLDFSLNFADERSAFLEKYLQEPQFRNLPPTEDELETMSNYVLWGKNRQTGLNPKQDGTIELAAKNSDWMKQSQVESLDALLEQPTFNEASLQNLCAPPLRQRREVFSRKEALEQCPAHLTDTFLSLFHQIDTLELQQNLYDIKHGKRTTPPRDSLLSKFSPEDISRLTAEVDHWNQFLYLKKRHLRIELCRQQYTLRDSFLNTVQSTNSLQCEPPTSLDFDAGIEVLPLGIFDQSVGAQLVFRPISNLIPSSFTEEDLAHISSLYWSKHEYAPSSNEFWIDFRSTDHLYQLFQFWDELQDINDNELDCHTAALMRAFRYYIDITDFSDIQREILEAKLVHKKNSDIAFDLNHKYNKSYTPNYISTIFTQRIVPLIAESALYHEHIIENIYFPEMFKKCTKCGQTFLLDPKNFTKKARSKDGYTTRCKKCEKEARSTKST